ncbi:RidA family protein [Mucilaginibacter sp. HD30]
MKQIFADTAPKAIGPYAHAISTGNLLYCSGQTPIDPLTMKIESDLMEEQTKRVIKNLELVLEAAGLTLNHIIKTNVFITDMELFTRMNAAYAECFGTHRPARTTVAVRGLPYAALVEIECIAEFNQPAI